MEKQPYSRIGRLDTVRMAIVPIYRANGIPIKIPAGAEEDRQPGAKAARREMIGMLLDGSNKKGK